LKIARRLLSIIVRKDIGNEPDDAESNYFAGRM
jgi:hypothetical protein